MLLLRTDAVASASASVVIMSLILFGRSPVLTRNCRKTLPAHPSELLSYLASVGGTLL